MKYYFPIIILLLVASVTDIASQELNAKLTINAQKLGSVNRDKFNALQATLTQLLNDQKWTDATFAVTERIDCSITITLNEALNETSFKGEIQLTSRRPVYNSSYITTVFNYRDTQFSFDYQQGQSYNFNSISITDNLVATLAYYAYVIIGLDFDTFSLNGGRSYFTKAMNIANSAQSLNSPGWEPFSNNKNRYDLALALTDESTKDFHTLYYNYHRLGLDEMALNASRGRIRIIEAVNTDLQKIYETRPSTPLLTVFAETKLDELMKIASEATKDEKNELKKKLTQWFPAKSNIINTLK